MHTSNQIEIRGDPDRVSERVFDFARDIEAWPRKLPHYRYLRVVEHLGDTSVADFGATRDGFPVSWRARHVIFPHDLRVTFQHVRGITRGMEVEWRILKGDGCVTVVIDHELTYPIPIVSSWFARYIVGRLFVQNIAGKTLRCLKNLIEAEEQKIQMGCTDI